jgi:hypothetical protein
MVCSSGVVGRRFPGGCGWSSGLMPVLSRHALGAATAVDALVVRLLTQSPFGRAAQRIER